MDPEARRNIDQFGRVTNIICFAIEIIVNILYIVLTFAQFFFLL